MAWQFGIYQMGKSIISNFHFIVKSILTLKKIKWNDLTLELN
jgi:hypothetical protein